MNSRRPKSVLLTAGLATSGLTLVSWTQTWFVVEFVPGEAGHTNLPIGGEIAAGALAALGLAGLALVGALAIAGPVFRAILGTLQVLLGATVALSAVLALRSPVRASDDAITEVTGISGPESLARLVHAVEPTFWPWFSVVLGVAGIATGIAILVTNSRWPGSSRKYQPVRFDVAESDDAVPHVVEPDAVGDWDALSDGVDPTSR